MEQRNGTEFIFGKCFCNLHVLTCKLFCEEFCFMEKRFSKMKRYKTWD